MTEEGKKLFKKVGIGLGGLLGLMLVLRLVLSVTGDFSRSARRDEADIVPLTQIAESESEPETEVAVYSAKRRLMNLLHARAFNHYRAQRYKDAIRLWEIAGYLDPKDIRVKTRLDEAKRALTYLIDKNAAIADQDAKALRFERSIEFYQRASNYAADFDLERYRFLQRQILRIEGKLAR